MSASSGGGSDGGPGHVAVCSNGVPSCAGGALFPKPEGTGLYGAVCGVGLSLTASGTALTGGLPCSFLLFLDCSLNKVPLAPPFSEKEEVCDTTRLKLRDRKRNNYSRNLKTPRTRTNSVTPQLTTLSKPCPMTKC